MSADEFRRQNYREVLTDGLAITRSEIPDLLDDDGFVLAVNQWDSYRRYGFPYAGGWMEQPCQLMDIIRIYDGLAEEFGSKNGDK